MINFELYHGDCLAVLRTMTDNSVDSIVTDPPYGLSFMGKRWDYDVPSAEIWAECLRVLKPGGHLLAFAGTRTQHRMAVRIEDAGFEIRDMIAWVYGSGFPKSRNLSGDWQGWGTALKPALEPITVARKPLVSASINVLQMVESELRERGVRGEIMWKPENVSGAEKKSSRKNSSSTPQQQAAETFAESAGENETLSEGRQSVTSSGQNTPNGENQTASMFANTTSESATNCATKSSMPTAESAPVVGSQNETSSPSTTSTEEGQPTERQFTGRSTTSFVEQGSQQATECFAGIATGLTGSMAHVLINRDSSGFFLWPQGLPKHVAGTPLTVAANVLAHGTGALNIDGCRVGGDAGRWPANLIHDGSDEVLAAFPEAKGQQGALTGSEPSSKTTSLYGEYAGRSPATPRIESDKSAARFFYCAKASRKDRNEGLEAFEVKRVSDGRASGLSGGMPEKAIAAQQNHHPTVKPTDLMAYLCRLVTPPGGVVLDPFMGSGSTGKAAMREGFRFIGIEREAEYLAIARSRIEDAQP